MSACCAASRDLLDAALVPGGSAVERPRGARPSSVELGVSGSAASPPGVRGSAPEGMSLIPGGPFLMGTDNKDGFPADGEGPIRQVHLKPFLIDKTAVTNT